MKRTKTFRNKSLYPYPQVVPNTSGVFKITHKQRPQSVDELKKKFKISLNTQYSMKMTYNKNEDDRTNDEQENFTVDGNFIIQQSLNNFYLVILSWKNEEKKYYFFSNKYKTQKLSELGYQPMDGFKITNIDILSMMDVIHTYKE